MRKVVLFLVLFICCIFLTGAEGTRASYYRSTYETCVVNSVEELDNVIEMLSEKKENVGEKYKDFDEAYFESKSLILIVLTNGLPSVEYSVENINITEEYAEFDIINYLPDRVNCSVEIIDLYVPIDFKVTENYQLRINEKDLK